GTGLDVRWQAGFHLHNVPFPAPCLLQRLPGQTVQQPERLYCRRHRSAVQHGEIRCRYQIGRQHHLLGTSPLTQPDRGTSQREHPVLAAIEADPVTRAQHSAPRLASHAATMLVTVASGCSGTDRFVTSWCRHSRWNSTGSTEIGSPTASAPAMSGVGWANATRSASVNPGTLWRGCRYPASHRRLAVAITSTAATSRYSQPSRSH